MGELIARIKWMFRKGNMCKKFCPTCRYFLICVDNEYTRRDLED